MTSTSTTGDLTAAKFSRLARRGVILGQSAAQLAVLAVGAVVLVAALLTGGTSLVYATPLLVACAGLAWVRVGGRPAIEWVPVAAFRGRRSATGQLDHCARIGKRAPRVRPLCPATPPACVSTPTPTPAPS